MKKFTALLLSGAIVATTLAACGGQNTTPTTTTAAQTTAATAAATESAAGEAEEVEATEAASVYPLDPGDTISLWWQMDAATKRNFSTMAETRFAQAWSEQTGIDIEWLHPTESAGTALNLMIVDGNLPDLIHYNFLNYGASKAIEEGVIIPLNDVIDQYMPNLKKYLEEHPDIDKMLKTDDGIYYEFPWIKNPLTTWDIVVRQDWLDDLGYDIPTTVDEWETVFRAFKEEKGAAYPWCARWGGGHDAAYRNYDPFMCAHNVLQTHYIGDDGKVHYGRAEEGYKDFLELYHNWYTEGILDVDFLSLTAEQVNTKILNGEAGATFAMLGEIEGWNKAATEEGFKLVAAPYPVLKKGDTPQFAHFSQAYTGAYGVAISTSCNDVERAARLIDYLYGEEGGLLANFGIEGETYEMIDGEPVFTDLVLNNPDGLGMTDVLSKYSIAYWCGPLITDARYQAQYYGLDEETSKAYELWQNNNMIAHILPPVTLTTDEKDEYSTYEAESYTNEWKTKAILGEVSIDEWDDLQATLKTLGIDRMIEIYQDTLDRYRSR